MAAGASSATPPILTPGTAGAKFDYETWKKKVEPALYMRQLVAPNIDEGDRPYSKHHIRKVGRIGSTSRGADSVDVGLSLTYQDLAPSEVTVNPGGRYVAIGWSEDEDAETDVPLDSVSSAAMEAALAEGIDSDVASLFSTATQWIGDGAYRYDAPGHRLAIANLMNLTYGNFEVGKVAIHGILPFAQYSDIVSIPEFNNAEMRGDGENPYVKGIWQNGGGIRMMLTTVLTQNGSGTHGGVWVPSFASMHWNVRGRTKRQEVELQNRLILYANYGYSQVHAARVVAIRCNAGMPALST